MADRTVNAHEVLKGLSFTDLMVEESGIVAGAVVIFKIVHDDGSISVQGRWDGATWLERPTMLRSMLNAEEFGTGRED